MAENYCVLRPASCVPEPPGRSWRAGRSTQDARVLERQSQPSQDRSPGRGEAVDGLVSLVRDVVDAERQPRSWRAGACLRDAELAAKVDAGVPAEADGRRWKACVVAVVAV